MADDASVKAALDALRNLRHVRIPGPDLAYMVVRGVVPDGGTLPGSLPTTADNLQLPPQLKLDTILEASRTGWDAKRFAGLVARSGLAMAPGLAAQARPFQRVAQQVRPVQRGLANPARPTRRTPDVRGSS